MQYRKHYIIVSLIKLVHIYYLARLHLLPGIKNGYPILKPVIEIRSPFFPRSKLRLMRVMSLPRIFNILHKEGEGLVSDAAYLLLLRLV